MKKILCIILASFIYLFSFGQKIIRFEKNFVSGYKTTDGKIIVEPKYNYAYDFSDGLALVGMADHKNPSYMSMGFIDETGKEVIPLIYAQYSSSFSNGLAVVTYYEGSVMKTKFINPKGEDTFPQRFERAHKFSDGLAPVKLNGKWGYVDRTGKMIVEAIYDYAYPFSEGLANISLEGTPSKCMYINNTGKAVFTIDGQAGNFTEGRATVRFNDPSTGKLGKTGLIDKTGKVVVEPQYDIIWNFSEGLAAAKKNDWIGYIDYNGKTVIPFMYTMANSFSEGLASVTNTARKTGFIDKSNKTIIPFEYTNGGGFNKGLAYASYTSPLGKTYSFTIDKENNRYNYRGELVTSVGDVDFQDGKEAYEKKDYKTAQSFFRKAVATDNSEAMLFLGDMFYYGYGVTANIDSAASWYIKAAGWGNDFAKLVSGYLYKNGKGVQKDDKLSTYWFKMASFSGNANIKETANAELKNIEGVQKQSNSLYVSTKEKALKGDALSLYNMGIYSENGYYGNQSITDAFSWWLKAAKAGYMPAAYKIGYMLMKGYGTEKNIPSAIEWLTKASNNGNAYAANQLSIIYETGDGVEKSRSKASYWWRIASKGFAEEHRQKQAEINAYVAKVNAQNAPKQTSSYSSSTNNYNNTSNQQPTSWNIGGGQYMQYRQSAGGGRILEVKDHWWKK